MYEDFVYYGNDADKKIEIAEKLGFSKLNFVIEIGKIDSVQTSIKEISNSKIEIGYYALVETKKDVNFANKKNLSTIYIYKNEADLRDVITSLNPDIITNIEFQKRDFIHHRSSGLNQIIAKLIAEKEIVLGINLGFLISTKHKGSVMGRIAQNIELANKYSIKVRAFSLAKSWNNMSSPKDMVSLLNTIGRKQKISKEALLKQV